MTRILEPEALTAEAFAPFGDVIELDGHEPLSINQGFAERFHNLARLDVSQNKGAPCLSIFRAKQRSFPISIDMMERHPLGSQAFMPLTGTGFLIVVATPEDTAPFKSLRAFISAPGQGVNYHPNVWHFPLLTLNDGDTFLVIDRKGPGENLEEVWFSEDKALLKNPELSTKNTRSNI
jgi:ureidoglycolate lyase